MNNRSIKRATSAQSEAEVEKKKTFKVFWWLLVCSLVAIFLSVLLLSWHQGKWFVWEASVNSELLGSLGDFVGGVLGTLIAVFSILMLVKTLHAQVDANADMKDTNQEMIKINKQQLFDNKFQVLYTQYKDAVAGYGSNSQGGKIDMEATAQKLLNQSFSCNLVYSLKVKTAVKVFEEFYAQNRVCCSLHFRVLYQLMRLINEGDIEDDDKAIYAKSIRGQLTDGEMAMLRYNCMTTNGRAMQVYVNRYDYLKHVPLMNLLEFKNWSSKVKDDHQLAALDSMFSSLRRIIIIQNQVDPASETPLVVSPRFVIKIIYESEHRCMVLRFEENKKAKSGGPVKHPYAEAALKTIGNKELPSLFQAFLYEVFLTSNFGLYGNAPNCVHSHIEVENTPSSFVFEIEVKGPNRLIISDSQALDIS